MVQEATLSFERVSKSFGTLKAVDDVSFAVESGGFFGLLGPNGAGKTTLINMLCGLNRISSGHVRVMGHDVAKHPLETRRRLGVVAQELVYDPYFNVSKCLEIQSNYYGISNNREWIGELLERLGLADRAKSNTRTLSGGMKRRLMIAQALVHKPPIIVLDEPTAGVDINLRRSLWEFIRELNCDGHTILLTTHYLEEAEQLCNDIVMMDRGRIIASESKKGLLARFKSIRMSVKLAGGACPPLYRERVCQELSSPETGHLVIALNNYGQIEDFLREVRQAGIAVEMMEIEHPDLEDIFIGLLREPEVRSAQGEGTAMAGDHSRAKRP